MTEEGKSVGDAVDDQLRSSRLVNGCASCPAAGFHASDSFYFCALDKNITPPTNDSQELYEAVPHGCPLWGGPITISLMQLRKEK